MNRDQRNIDILAHIVSYCDQIEETKRRLGHEFNLFEPDFVYQNAVAMCVLQIGELAKHLDDDFIRTFDGRPLAADSRHAQYDGPPIRQRESKNSLGYCRRRHPPPETLLRGTIGAVWRSRAARAF